MLVSQIARLIVTTKSPTLSRLYQRSYQIASEIYCLLSPNFRKLLNEYEDGHYSLNTYPHSSPTHTTFIPHQPQNASLLQSKPLPNRALVDPSHYPIRTADSYCNWQIRRVQGQLEIPPLCVLLYKLASPFLCYKNANLYAFPETAAISSVYPNQTTKIPGQSGLNAAFLETYSTISTYRRGQHCLDVIPNSAYNWYKITS